MTSSIRSAFETSWRSIAVLFSSTRMSFWSVTEWMRGVHSQAVIVWKRLRDCVAETQTGYQRRRPEHQIDPSELRDSLATIHSVGDRERAELAVPAPDIALDRGEKSLWAHALNRHDHWMLCGPDKASLRLGVRLGFRERLVALEQLLNDIGYRPRTPLRRNYTRKWLAETCAELVLAEGM